jgi:AcrR family transcriptional regulator
VARPEVAGEPDVTSTAPRWVRLTHEDRRAQILAKACDLFSRRTYTAVSMEDIAGAAGVTRGLLNHYFGTKRELYLQVIRYMTRLPPTAAHGVPGDSVNDTVRRNVDLYLDAAERNRASWLAMMGGAGFGRDREIERVLHDVEEAYVDRIIEIFGGDPRSAPPVQRAALRSYGVMAQAVSREWLAGKRMTRDQAHLFLSETLFAIVDHITPKLLA